MKRKGLGNSAEPLEQILLVAFVLVHLVVDAVAEQGLRLNCQVDAE